MNKDSAEYKTVIGLYNDGKITAQERDRLLDALGFEDGETKKDSVYINVTDGSRSDENDELEPEGIHIHTNDAGSLGKIADKITDIAESISESVEKKLKFASEALARSGRKLRDAVSMGVPETVLDLGDEKNDYKRIKEIKYDEPYESLVITVKYTDGVKLVELSDKTTESESLIKKCAEKTDMTADDLNLLRKTVSDRFTGKYVRIDGDKVLKITVSPD